MRQDTEYPFKQHFTNWRKKLSQFVEQRFVRLTHNFLSIIDLMSTPKVFWLFFPGFLKIIDVPFLENRFSSHHNILGKEKGFLNFEGKIQIAVRILEKSDYMDPELFQIIGRFDCKVGDFECICPLCG